MALVCSCPGLALVAAALATGCAPGPARAPDDAGPTPTDAAIAPPEAAVDAGSIDSGPEAAEAAPVVDVDAGSGQCAAAIAVPLGSAGHRLDLTAGGAAAPRSIDPPCATTGRAEVFYELLFSEPALVYADTFGAPGDTVLFLLSGCAPLTAPTMDGDAVCSDDACGTPQSQLVARVAPGRYELGVTGRSDADAQAVVHLSWALAGSGVEAPLPSGSSVQSGTTSGSGNLTDLSPSCLAAGPEDSYWWTSCPQDPAGTLTASTCDAATWETVLELQVPGSTEYACNVDGCGLQAALTASIPAGAGLRVLSIDGESGEDLGPYMVTVSRP